MDKNLLRKEFKQKRRDIDVQKIEVGSRKICACILRLKEYMEADVVYLYMAINNEVDVTLLFEESAKRNKKIVVPRVLDDSRMEFYVIESMDSLKKGFMGILEPVEGLSVYKGNENEKSIMILPGVVFDRKGGRIGMGKGYYDRYLAENHIDVLCGVGMNFQLLKDDNYIETDDHDKYLDIIVTEFEIIYPS